MDIAPTVLRQLGLPVRPAWKLDGRPLSRSRGTSSALVAVRGRGAARRLAVSLRLAGAPAGVRSVVLRLPASVEVAGSVRALVNGRPVSAAPSGSRTIVARFSARALRRLSLVTAPGSIRVAAGVGGTAAAQATVILRGRKGSRGTLRVALAH